MNSKYKYKIKYAVLLLIFFAGIFMSCEKSSTGTNKMPLLPDETQNGANTFGCIVNGIVWLPSGNQEIPAASFDYSTPPTIVIRANNITRKQSFEISLQHDFSITSYILNDTLPGQIIKFSYGGTDYLCDSVKSGNLTLTKFDAENRIISGVFYFDAVADTMRYDIRLGRFDLAY